MVMAWSLKVVVGEWDSPGRRISEQSARVGVAFLFCFRVLQNLPKKVEKRL